MDAFHKRYINALASISQCTGFYLTMYWLLSHNVLASISQCTGFYLTRGLGHPSEVSYGHPPINPNRLQALHRLALLSF